jgi:hypothetical protein
MRSTRDARRDGPARAADACSIVMDNDMPGDRR